MNSFALVEFDERNYKKLKNKVGSYGAIKLPDIYGHQIRFLSEKEVAILNIMRSEME